MTFIGDTQRCSKCGEEKPLAAFRRQSHRSNGRDSICRACRKQAYRRSKDRSFGPLPGAHGSEEWVHEIWRRADRIRSEKHS